MVSLQRHWPLVLLALIPLLWWIRRATSDHRDRSPLALPFVRSMIVALAAFALCEPAAHRMASGDASVIYVLDVSTSIAPESLQKAISWIRKNAAGREGRTRVVAFGADARLFDSIEALEHAPSNALDRSGTDIAGAITLAAHSFEAGMAQRLVLLSDGNGTRGQFLGLAQALRQSGTHVDTVPLAPRADAWIEALVAPLQVAAEEEFALEAQVFSPSNATATLELRAGTKVLESRTVPLVEGPNRIGLHTRLPEEARMVTIEAQLRIAGDPFPANNVNRTAIWVEGRPHILYAEGHAPSAHYLEGALKTEGLRVDVIDARSIPDSDTALDDYDAVILSDVDRNVLSDGQMQALSTYVRERGGGFILAGGENNYGESGYSKTAIEDMLPVRFEAPKPNTTAMVVVLDRSGSMGAESKMDLAKEATKAPVALLKDTDHFGVVAFDTNFSWIVPLAAVEDRPAIIRKIGAIFASGNTSIYPALEEASISLAKDNSEIKHVILLTDGRDPIAQADSFKELVTRMADSGMTVTTVAVGSGADAELLSDIARWGKGRAYAMDSPNRVLQVFNEDAKIVTQAFKEETFRPIVRKQVDAFKGIDLETAPQLLGYVASRAKDTAEILLEAHTDEPLLARWQFGLGKTAVFTSDVKDRWAVNWLGWKGYAKFWSQLVRETMRRRANDAFRLHVERTGDSATIRIDAVGASGQLRNRLVPEIRVTGPDQRVIAAGAAQTGPGSYEQRFPIGQVGSYLLTATDGEGHRSDRVIEHVYPNEYRFHPLNADALRALSLATGGGYNPQPGDIFDATRETARITLLAPYLTALALILFIVEVLLRRALS